VENIFAGSHTEHHWGCYWKLVLLKLEMVKGNKEKKNSALPID
jgi:hypothetical protein